MYENVGKLVKKSHSFSKEIIIYMLCTTYSIIQILVMILQQSVRIKDNKLGFYFIFSHFPFIFSYFLLKEYKTKKTKCDTVTGYMTWTQKSHAHMI